MGDGVPAAEDWLERKKDWFIEDEGNRGENKSERR